MTWTIDAHERLDTGEALLMAHAIVLLCLAMAAHVMPGCR
jgi:hypothetical protein